MVDKICDTLLNKIRKADLSIDDEKAEIIYYGLQNLVGELPKIFIVCIISIILGLFNQIIIGTIVLMAYRGFAGGVHLKTHISCLLTSVFLMIGSSYLAKNFIYTNPLLIYSVLFCFDFLIAILFAPADTENRPIMKLSQKRKQKIISCSILIIIYVLSEFAIKNRIVTNIFMYMITIESFMITPLAYKIFDNKTGEERRKAILEERDSM